MQVSQMTDLGQPGVAGADMPWAKAAHALPALLRCTDQDGQCRFVNRAWQDFTGLRQDQARGRGWESALHPEDLPACRATLHQAVAASRPFRLQYRLRRADGAWRGVVEEGRAWFHAGQVAHVVAQGLDVTDIHALVERERMVDERDSLIRELQHRVRNNAQATSSMLSLQAGRSRDPVVATALRGAAARVLLATQVQDRMFQMASSATVELGPEVIAAAQAACDVAGQDRARLHCVIASGIAVPVRQAAPLALIVNELTTNALHHAFAPDSVGQVRVTLRRLGAGEAELEVADDGVGLPQTPGIGGLGLHLAARLASQAGSSLVVEAPPEGAGTRLRLRFPDPPAAAVG